MKSQLAFLPVLAFLCVVACAPPHASPVSPTPNHRFGAALVTPVGPGTGNGTINQYDTQAFANSGVIDAVPGTFLGCYGFNKSASAILYVQFFNSTTVPADTAVPSFTPVPLSPGATFTLIGTATVGTQSFGPIMTSGLAWAASTTAATKTVDSSSSVWLTCQYY